MTLSPRLVSSEKRGEDADATLRPQTLDEFVGQAAARANLKVFVEAAKGRGEATAPRARGDAKRSGVPRSRRGLRSDHLACT